MDHALIQLIAATTAFVISHFVMSGPIRSRLQSMLGGRGFLLFYSLVSLSVLAWAMVTFDRVKTGTPLWDGMAAGPWVVASLLTITGTAFLLPSFTRNPALAGANAAGVGTWIPAGVFRITRHPMMWGIALWALGHIVASPTPRVLVVMSGLIVLALLGSHFQDKRKVAQNKREFHPWQRRTSFWPRLQELGALRLAWAIAFLVWFIATWLHYHFFGIPAGLWMWIG
ncbi:MFS transporter [Novosphingobium sp. THN1]|uniref:NnrU family protein n=1 Tax=Novosphingobium sp. THN1 TaxID=1016987 RepID=UPI000E471A16|nr:NnrU family protein [Novosphingobium sp. THN1]AXU18587.1 MFS transporter [Novosphingobium sp. THN1]